MAAVPAYMHFPSSSQPGFAFERPSQPAEAAAKLRQSLGTLFPDLLVHGTRNCLLHMTTSLTKVSGRVHDYFARVSQVLAFERMMREFMRMGMAMSAFPMEFMAATAWGNMFGMNQRAPSPWNYLQQSPRTLPAPMLSFFGGGGFQPQSQPQHAPSSQPRLEPWSDYHSLLVVPLAFLLAMPAPDTWWNSSV